MSDAQNAKKLPKPLPDIETREGRWEVLQRAAKGDKAIEPLVRKMFDRDRREDGLLLEIFGNTFTHVCSKYAKRAAGDDLGVREALTRKIVSVRDELAGPNPTPLERILCERVALTLFDANESDRRYVDQSKLDFKDAEYRESRRDRAHKRFLAACKTLATIRRLGVPAIQVNLAHQQVNVAGST